MEITFETGQGFPEDCGTLNQHLIYGAIYLIARINGSKNQGVKMVVTPLTITPSDH